MTFSLLSLDKNTGTFAGATATGNLCVGGWVLRGQDVGILHLKAQNRIWGKTHYPDARKSSSTR